ncbi:MAG: SDR family NAD(P)-dependent oxidoreductase [Alphaproteobacteria bacterium]|nr:SDR family NAD(P)-dependent oxidoreductase [Alphaproteobacteria bacterium]
MKDKTFIVTGAFGALGTAVVRALEAAGAKVAAIDAAPAPAGGNNLAYGGVDLSDSDAAGAAIVRAISDMGGLDGLVNVAGTFRWESVADGDVATWDLLYRINVRTAVIASKAALPALERSRGAIVSVSAAASAKAAAGMGAYTASKSGVSRLTEALADEMKDKGVRVNAVLPTIIDTAANRKDMPDADFSKWVSPDALADAILFLLSDKARAITGALLPVSGRV